MSVIYGNPIITNGGGVKLNIDYGATPPSDTTKLWVPLATKPSAVECSPILNYGSEIPASASFGTGFSTFQTGVQICHYGKYVFAVDPYIGNYGGYVFKYDTELGTHERITIPDGDKFGKSPIAFSVGKYIYAFDRAEAAYSSYVLKIDVTTNTFTKLKDVNWPYSGSNSYYFSSGCVDGANIYLVGSTVGSIQHSTVTVFDTETEKFISHVSMPVSAQGTCYSSCVANGTKVYSFGGSTRVSFDPARYLQVFDVDTGEYSRHDILPESVNSSNKSIRAGEYAYIFASSKKIIKVDLRNFTAEYLSASFAGSTLSCGLGFANEKWYLLGNGSNVYTFTVQTNLAKNNLFLQADFGFNNPFPLINDKGVKITAYLRNAYLGDNNNIAQLTNAYLYDTASSQWKTLSGESYVADMQKALNILGVN